MKKEIIYAIVMASLIACNSSKQTSDGRSGQETPDTKKPISEDVTPPGKEVPPPQPNPPERDPSIPFIPDEAPSKLSETKYFKDLKSLEAISGLKSYQVNHPFWSDYSEKSRWIYSRGTSFEQGKAVVPDGSVFIKHFDMPSKEGSVENMRKIETRIFLRKDGVWSAWIYKWNDAQDDAVLTQGGETIPLSIEMLDGQQRQVQWNIPTIAQCFTCHNANAGTLLAVKPSQFNINDQLATHLELGTFKKTWNDEDEQALIARNAQGADVTQHARTYLDVNCSFCHQPGSIEASLDLRSSSDLSSKFGASHFYDDLGITGVKVIDPSVSSNSLIWLRMSRTDQYHMPTISSKQADPIGLQIISSWIDQLPAPTPEPEPVTE